MYTRLLGVYTLENCNILKLCAKDLGGITTINLNEVPFEGYVKNYGTFYAASFFSTADRHSKLEGKMLLNYGVMILKYPTTYITLTTKLNFHAVMRNIIDGSRHVNMINTQDFMIPGKGGVFVTLYNVCLKLLLQE